MRRAEKAVDTVEGTRRRGPRGDRQAGRRRLQRGHLGRAEDRRQRHQGRRQGREQGRTRPPTRHEGDRREGRRAAAPAKPAPRRAPRRARKSRAGQGLPAPRRPGPAPDRQAGGPDRGARQAHPLTTPADPRPPSSRGRPGDPPPAQDPGAARRAPGPCAVRVRVLSWAPATTAPPPGSGLVATRPAYASAHVVVRRASPAGPALGGRRPGGLGARRRADPPGAGFVAAGKLTKPAWSAITALAAVLAYFVPTSASCGCRPSSPRSCTWSTSGPLSAACAAATTTAGEPPPRSGSAAVGRQDHPQQQVGQELRARQHARHHERDPQPVADSPYRRAIPAQTPPMTACRVSRVRRVAGRLMGADPTTRRTGRGSPSALSG